MKIESVHFSEKIKTYEELITILVNGIESLPIDKKKIISEEVIAREKIASTFLPCGVAFPHCRTKHTSSIYTAVGILKTPVLFGENKDKKTHTVFLIISPADNPKKHLRHLATLAKALKTDGFIDKLKTTDTDGGIVSLMHTL